MEGTTSQKPTPPVAPSKQQQSTPYKNQILQCRNKYIMFSNLQASFAKISDRISPAL